MSATCRTPVVFVLFNRPETTARAFEQIRAARPGRLFILADGPRADHRADRARCEAARAVVDTIDWPCEVTRDYADTNLGIKTRVGAGLTAVFGEVDTAIILEDDCVPDPTFFRFCDELLARYADDPRVMTISGGQFLPDAESGGPSYRFSRQPLIWGWATWRRAWAHYDGTMHDWPRLHAERWLDRRLESGREREYWSYLFDRDFHLGAMANWDYAWQFACWQADALAIHPTHNLVSNIGFGADATHCTDPRHVGASVPTRPMAFPLTHPPAVVRDVEADRALEERLFSGQLGRLLANVRRRIRR